MCYFLINYLAVILFMTPGAREHIPLPDRISEAEQEADISLITGEMRATRFYPPLDPEPTSSTAVTCRSHSQTVAHLSPAGMCSTD